MLEWVSDGRRLFVCALFCARLRSQQGQADARIDELMEVRDETGIIKK